MPGTQPVRRRSPVAFALLCLVGNRFVPDLQRIKLVELRHVLDVLSVGDVVLCLVGYGVGRELLRAALRRPS